MLAPIGDPPGLIGSERKIVNLSSRQLMQDEITVLRLGLKFIQNPIHQHTILAPTQLLADIEATFEKYIWPKTMSAAQNNIMKGVFKHIRNKILAIETVPPRPNFSQRLKIALKSLREDPTIIISKADKGDAVVVMDADHYYGLAMKHLADSSTYELLESDPSEQIVSDYHDFLDRCVRDKYWINTNTAPCAFQTIIRCKLFTSCLKYTNTHLS